MYKLSSNTCAPADRFTNGYEKILGLFCNRRESFKDDMTILWTDPKRTRSMVRFQM